MISLIHCNLEMLIVSRVATKSNSAYNMMNVVIPVNPPPFRGSLPHGLGLMRGRH